jgi:hypothetical protein
MDSHWQPSIELNFEHISLKIDKHGFKSSRLGNDIVERQQEPYRRIRSQYGHCEFAKAASPNPSQCPHLEGHLTMVYTDILYDNTHRLQQ